MTRIVYGVQPVRELLESGSPAPRALILKAGSWGPALRQIQALAREKGTKTRTAEEGELERLCRNGNHQGVAAEVEEFAYADLDSWLGSVRDRTRSFAVALDGVQDPHNLGAILRTAEVLGATGLLLPKDRSVQVTDAVVRASAGAAHLLPVVRVTNLSRALSAAKEAGFWIVGASDKAAASLYETELPFPALFVLGGEGSGVRPGVEAHCDLMVSIPTPGKIASLNVSVACGVILAEAMRRIGQAAAAAAATDPSRSEADGILFLCTGNSCRSQMAEGLARSMGLGGRTIWSAGTRADGMNPYAVQAMAEIGIDLASQWSKALDEIPLEEIGEVVTLCDRAREACPIFPLSVRQRHWGFPDPADATGAPEEILETYRRVRDAIRVRLESEQASFNRLKKDQP